MVHLNATKKKKNSVLTSGLKLALTVDVFVKLKSQYEVGQKVALSEGIIEKEQKKISKIHIQDPSIKKGSSLSRISAP